MKVRVMEIMQYEYNPVRDYDEDGNLLGIGWVEENKILAVAAVEKGAGEAVMHTLLTLVKEDTAIVEVASTNAKAIRLYEKLGFTAYGPVYDDAGIPHRDMSLTL